MSATIAHLRSECNRNGISCKDHMGGYLSRLAMVKKLQQVQTGGGSSNNPFGIPASQIAILRQNVHDMLQSYAEDSTEIIGAYIDVQTNIVVNATLADKKFNEIYQEHPDLEDWAFDWFALFLDKYSSIHSDYPHGNSLADDYDTWARLWSSLVP